MGEIVEFKPGAGFMGCDLVDVRYQQPSDGAWHTMPLSTDAVGAGSRKAMLEWEERYEREAASLREASGVAAEVRDQRRDPTR